MSAPARRVRRIYGTDWPIEEIYGKARTRKGWFVAQICNGTADWTEFFPTRKAALAKFPHARAQAGAR